MRKLFQMILGIRNDVHQYRCTNFFVQKLITLEHEIMADLTELRHKVEENTSVIESAIDLLNGLKAKLEGCTSQAEIDDLKKSIEDETAKLAEAVAKNT